MTNMNTEDVEGDVDAEDELIVTKISLNLFDCKSKPQNLNCGQRHEVFMILVDFSSNTGRERYPSASIQQ